MKESTIGILTDKIGRITCIKCGEELDVGEYTIFERVLCPVCEAEQTVPGKLGNFLLMEELGRGGMGAVYLAKDESLGREVALKVLRQEYGSDPRFMDRLLQEAQAAAALNHRNVVQIYSFGQENGQPYIVMELVNGGRFDLLMKEQEKVDEEVLLETAVDVAHGLQAAANVGLIHGDIKPANILYDRKGVAKVVDFGLAKFEGNGAKIEIWGTPYYIAPEKARGKSEDFRSDMYSLGATLYHALAGVPPFDGPTPTDVVVARLKAAPPDVREKNPAISLKTSSMIKRSMDPAPGMRYPTWDSFIADLEEALRALRESRALASAPPPSKKKWPLIIAGIAGVVALVVGVLVFSPGKQEGNGATTSRNHASLDADYWKNFTKGDRTPFSRAEGRQLIEAMGKVKPGSSLAALDSLVKVKNAHAEGSPGRAWLETFQVILHMIHGEGDPARELLKGLLAPGVVRFESSPPPIEDPITINLFLANRIEEDEFRRRTRGGEMWFRHFAEMIIGFKRTLNAQTKDVPSILKDYAEANHDFQWSYAWQPFASKLAVDAASFSRLAPGGQIEPAEAARIRASFQQGNFEFWGVALRKLESGATGRTATSTGSGTPSAGTTDAPNTGNQASYAQRVASLTPLLRFDLNDKATGQLAAAIDPQKISKASYAINGVNRSEGALGPGQGFAESNTYFSMAERSAFDFILSLVPDGAMSASAGAVSFWVRTSSTENNEMFYARVGGDEFRVRLLGSGVAQASLGGAGGFDLRTPSNLPYNRMNWVHITCSWGNGEVSLSVVPLTGAPSSVKASFEGRAMNMESVRFGKDLSNNAVLYQGDVDDITIWNRALSSTELRTITGL